MENNDPTITYTPITDGKIIELESLPNPDFGSGTEGWLIENAALKEQIAELKKENRCLRNNINSLFNIIHRQGAMQWRLKERKKRKCLSK